MKFSLDWLGDFLDVSAAGGLDAVRSLLDRAGLPVESLESAGEDTVLEVEIGPNRPDAMNHRGLAREVAAMGGTALRDFSSLVADPPSSGPPAESLTSVAVEVPKLCRRFGARVLRGVRADASPERVRRRLAAIALKPIGAVVDSTNYSLWDIGQPLHAFDLDRLRGGRLIVRKARPGEKLVTLDGAQLELLPSDIVVADEERAVSLAGIIGGLETAVSEKTRNVLLEAAWWDPVSIRRTARRLGLHTDASHRFERGADPEAIPAGLNRAAHLILEAAGGILAPGIIDACGEPFRPRRAFLRLSRLRRIAGEERLDLELSRNALSQLGFAAQVRGRRLAVSIPSFRPDVSIEEDLIEEVLRVYGYDRLPSRLPAIANAGGYLEPLREVEERLADLAVAAGLYETVNSPFLDREIEEGPYSSWLEATETAPPLSISNPLDETRKHLRATLLPGLLDAVSRNARYGRRDVALFEIGRVFGRPGDPDRPETFESRRFAFALAGEARSHWSFPPEERRTDSYDAKGLVERLLEPWVSPEELSWGSFRVEAFVPGATSRVEVPPGRTLGVLGLIAAAERGRRHLPETVFAGELLVEAIPSRLDRVRFEPYSAFPAITSDLSFSHAVETSWEQIEGFVKGEGLENLESVRIFDRYRGPGVPEGRVKTTVRLTFRSLDRTLSQEEVNRERDRLAAALAANLGADF